MPQLALFENERWAPVPNFEERYSVSDKGRVKGLYRDKILTPQTASGYPNQKVELYRQGDRTRRSIARLVLEVFGDPPSEGDWVVRHLDEDRSNNRIENLKPVSRSSFSGRGVDGDGLENPDEWEPIPGWDGDYLAHRSGRIFSIKSNKVLAFSKRSGSESGYYVRLRKNGEERRINPARLIIKTFQDPVLSEGKWKACRITHEKDFCVSNLVPRSKKSWHNEAKHKKQAHEKMHTEYKDRAKRGEIRFMLSEADFADLCYEDCYYCGARPSYMKSVDGVVNGIDRLYPDVGYVKKNCVPCCSECNVGKATSTPSDFVERAVRIANRHSPNDIRIPRSSVDVSGHT